MRDSSKRIWNFLSNPKVLFVPFMMMTCLVHMQIYRKNNNFAIVIDNLTNADDIIARRLQDVKLFCLITTMAENHMKRAIHVKQTWGKRCDKLLFMSSVNNSSLPSIDLGIKEERKNLWKKTRKAFKHVYDNYLEDYQWFLKADDDTYVVVENLRYMLSNHEPEKVPIYFGRRIHGDSPNGFMSGGAGYVLSQYAVRLFAEVALPNRGICPEEGLYEDVEMGKCLQNVGVITGESRDVLNRGKFFPLAPVKHLHPGKSAEEKWFRNYAYYPSDRGRQCCSDLAISFHYVKPQQMYELDYLIYQLHPYGSRHPDHMPHIPPTTPNNQITYVKDPFDKKGSQNASVEIATH